MVNKKIHELLNEFGEGFFSTNVSWLTFSSLSLLPLLTLLGFQRQFIFSNIIGFNCTIRWEHVKLNWMIMIVCNIDMNSTKFNLLNWIESTLNWPEMNNNTIVLWSCLKQNWASFIIDELHKIDSYFPVYKSGYCKALFDFFLLEGKPSHSKQVPEVFTFEKTL